MVFCTNTIGAVLLKRLILVICALGLSASLFVSCDEEEYSPVKPRPEPSEFKSLAEKDDALFNLELLFNAYNSAEYDRLLGESFVFIFSDADFSGGITPDQWDRATEIRSYNGFFDPTREDFRVTGRSLKLTYPEDNWTEITPDDPVQYPGESWYFTTVIYDMAVTLDVEPELTLIANGMKMEVIIRWDGEKNHYRMIRWRDDMESGYLLARRGAAVEETTWGGMKALYQ
jgi:hypothetical protein